MFCLAVCCKTRSIFSNYESLFIYFCCNYKFLFTIYVHFVMKTLLMNKLALEYDKIAAYTSNYLTRCSFPLFQLDGGASIKSVTLVLKS